MTHIMVKREEREADCACDTHSTHSTHGKHGNANQSALLKSDCENCLTGVGFALLLGHQIDMANPISPDGGSHQKSTSHTQ